MLVRRWLSRAQANGLGQPFRNVTIVITKPPPRKPPQEESNTMRRLISAWGLFLTGTGITMIALSKRPSRLSVVVLGSGAVLTLAASPQLATIPTITSVGAAGLALVLGPFYLHDVREREIQAIFMEAKEKVDFGDAVRFDESGPVPNAVSRPRYHVLVGPFQALLNNDKEQVRVEIAGYEIGPSGEHKLVVAYAFASRSFPWDAFVIDRIDKR